MGTVSTTIKVVDKASTNLTRIYNNIERINKSFEKLNKSKGLTKAIATIKQTSEALDKATVSTTKLDTEMEETVTSTNKVAKSVKSIGDAAKSGYQPVNLLMGKLRRLASIYLGVMGSKAALNTSDMLTSANIKFTSLGVDPNKTMNKIFNASQAALTDYADMVSNVSKSVMLAGDAFGDNAEKQVDNAIKFQEIMAKTYAISGASYQEQQSSMYQLVQALNSGTLQGDELRSVREGAPMAAKAIEKFAQKVTGSTKSLKEMGSEGLITSKMVVEAILDMEDETDKAFENIRKNMTFAQIWTEFKNNAIRAFQPFLETLREIANSKGFQMFISDITSLLYGLGNVLTMIGNLAKTVFDVLGDHADAVRPIIIALTSALGVLAAVQLVSAAASAIKAAAAFLALHANTVILFAGIALLIWYFNVAGLSAQSLSYALLALGAAGLVAGLMLNAPFYLVIGVIALLTSVFLMFTEQFVAGLYLIASVLYNVVAAGWDIIMGVVEAIYNVAAALANFLGNLFNDPIAAIIGLFVDLGDVVIGIIESIASAIDKVFGSNLAGAVSGFRDTINQWYDKTFDPVEYAPKFEDIFGSKDDLGLDRWAYSDAFSQGWQTGGDIQDFINNKLGALGSGFTGLFDSAAPPDFAQIWPLPTDINDALGDIGDIKGDTGDINKKMDLTDEDLKYLRQIAEQEAINKWTAATIHVDMKNENNIHDMNDIDGIAIGLSTVLQTELQVLANGWHDA